MDYKLELIAVPSTDWERSRAFYVDTLGLRPDPNSKAEFWVGETCCGIYEPATVGFEFAPQRTAHLAFHVDDMAARAPSTSRAGSPSSARRWTPASATWPSSRTPTATR